MLYWSALFLLLAVTGGAAGVGGIAGFSLPVGCGLFLLGTVMAVIALLLEREPLPLPRDLANHPGDRR